MEWAYTLAGNVIRFLEPSTAVARAKREGQSVGYNSPAVEISFQEGRQPPCRPESHRRGRL